jgi:hypothetical protein
MEKPTGFCVAASLTATQWAACHETITTILRNAPKGSCMHIPPSLTFFRAADGYWAAHDMVRFFRHNNIPTVLTPVHGPLAVHLSPEHERTVRSLGIEVHNASNEMA